MPARPTRRTFLAGTGAFAVLASIGFAAARAEHPPPPPPATGELLPLTPECVDADDLTPAQTEGPYFTPDSPERASLLEPDMAGARLYLSGFVLTQACQP